MKTIKPVLIVVCSLIFTGCVTTPKQNDRYLQIKHPISGVVGYQIALPSSDACSGMLGMVDSNEKSKGMKPFFVCSSTSASATLPARATVRNKVYSFIFDVEAINLKECNSVLEGMMASEGKDNLEVVSLCAAKS
jgi:hypothetical protein